VCGAPNTRAGVHVPVALPGSKLPNGLKVKPAKIRGVKSYGMICAEDELGVSADHAGIIFLPDDVPIGAPVTREMLGFEDDAVLEIGLTPNRGDCLSHLGVAREIATLLELPLQDPSVEYSESGPKIADKAAVSIQDPDLCYRYTASLITDVTIKPSPLWLRRRLEHVGIRAISNVVDVTNYVMMELGQPLHAFDFDTVADHKIIVRRANPDEKFTTLDNVERQMDPDMLMIADGARSVGIGGVMGGLNSEISDTTTTILLESAYFSPASIRRTSKTLGLSTEASYRFERYIDLLRVDFALKRATKLIAELGGGTVASSIIDEFPYAYTPNTVTLRPERVADILGIPVSAEKIRSILSHLGFTVTSKQADSQIAIEVPSYRPDVEREIDIIEEIGRIYGYDNIPTTLPSGEIPPKLDDPARDVAGLAAASLLGQGFYETVTYSFFDSACLKHLLVAEQAPYAQVVPLKNPLNAEQDVMRTTLIPGLLQVLTTNSQHAENLGFFEIGRVFWNVDPKSPLPEERVRIAGVLAGTRQPRGWNRRQDSVDFYDARGVLENLFQAVGVVNRFHPLKKNIFFHPGESAEIMAENQVIGIVGRLHPDVVENFQLDKDPVYIFELFLEKIVDTCILTHQYTVIPKFPAVHRDLAVVVPENMLASDVEAAIREAGTPLLEHALLFDRYVGPQISGEAVGLTYSLTYRSVEKTLIDDEVNRVHQRIIERLRSQLGVNLR
jgi:phenylalanyl-tRNA synthetase beta chain